MWSIEEIFSQLDQNFEAVHQAVQAMNPARYTQRPTEDKWSPAEHIEHLLLTDMVITQMISGEGTPAEARSSNEIMAHVINSFANMGKQFTAFGPLIPQGNFPDQIPAFEQWAIIRTGLKQVVQNQDPHHLATGFIHPLVGEPMSRLEWLMFCVIHGERHLRLIEAY
ncbi:MAG: DinB family protein [Bacteroidota bacterium]